MQVGLSYFQAGQAIDWLVRDYGQDAINGMVDSFAKQEPLEDILKKHLKLTPKEFDEKLDAYLKAKWLKSAERLADFKNAMNRGKAALDGKNWDATIAEVQKAREAFPEHVASYEALGKAYTEKGDMLKAREYLREYAKRGGRATWALKELAKVEEKQGDKAMAAEALQRLIYIAPVGDEELHKKLGEYYLELGKADRAMPAFLAQLASKPVDPAGAYYNLARSYLALSRRPDAQEALLQALELAPGFKPAQKLLLEMDSSPQSDSPVPKKKLN
jgi:tetratricopeptide (TPR) repeat protein